MRVADTFLRAVHERLASHPPERGGAVIGFNGTAHFLLEDDFGVYSSASYDISAELTEAIARVEARGYGRLIGTVHTHPTYHKDPSGRDELTMQHALIMNPHLETLMVCVVTPEPARPMDVAFGPGSAMSVHLMRRDAGEATMTRVNVEVVPLAADLEAAGLPTPGTVTVTDVLAGRFDGLAPVWRVNDVEKLVCRDSRDREVVFVDAAHPRVSPILAVPGADGLQALAIEWDKAMPVGPQIRVGFDAAAAKSNQPDQFDRVRDIVGNLCDAKVLVVGAGSVGSRIAEDLTRSSVGYLTVIDPDTVSAENLARSVYTNRDVGSKKVDALAARLTDINAEVSVDPLAMSISEFDVRVLDGFDLVVLATDDMQEQGTFAAAAYHAGVPQVSCALYRRAAAGEVALIVPSLGSACWSCCVGTNAVSTESRPDRNYGVDSRLVAESGLGPSINLVASVASLCAIGVLTGPDGELGKHWLRLLRENRTMGIVSTVPAWDFFGQLMGDPHQSHPQSAWPRQERNAHCPVCGSGLTDVLTSEDSESFADLVAAQPPSAGNADA